MSIKCHKLKTVVVRLTRLALEALPAAVLLLV